jgi:cystathionine beta-lyase/cystathionine gamma-synthase
MKTMPLRVARQNESAMTVASALDGHPRLVRVYHPGLASHPDHAIAARQMSGFGGMVTIDVRGGQAAAFRTFDRFNLIKRATSLGGVESICSLPILSSHTGLSDEQLAAAGVSRGMIRISIGLEDAQDIIEDVQQALASLA